MLYRLHFHTALFAVAWAEKRRGNLAPDDYTIIVSFLQGNNTVEEPLQTSPQVDQLANQVWQTGVDNNAIDPKVQPPGSINWANLLAFIQALLPIILQFIQILNPPKPVPTPSLPAGKG